MIEDSVTFTTVREQQRSLTHAASVASAPAFAAICNNSEAVPAMPAGFGDAVLMSFPFTSQATSNRGPLSLSTTATITAPSPISIMATSIQFRLGLAFGNGWLQDSQAAGLIKPSVVKPAFTTLEQSLVTRMLGALSARNAQTFKNDTSQI